jgi:hypothetical protein
MKFFLAICCGLIAAVAANMAVAGPFGDAMRFLPSVQAQSTQPEPQRNTARPAPQRDMRGPGEADRGRMNPEERRQLRRDIQDAGKDIYRPAQQERRDGRRSGRR